MNVVSPSENPPPPEKRIFPMEVRHKRSASAVIYAGSNRGQPIFTVVYQSEGSRQHSMRRDFEAVFARGGGA